MPDEPLTGDAFGALMADQLGSGQAIEIIERDDSFIGATPAGRYFYPPGDWHALDIAALDGCTGRVLDVGAGAGRAALALQDRGQDVVALDTSAGAIEVCRRRGVRDTFTGTVAEFAARQPGPFGTFLLLGNNLGLLEGARAATGFLAALAALAGPGAVVFGTGADPYATSDPVHLGYQERNRAAGRMGGQLRLRVRHRRVASAWFDYLLCSAAELEELVAGTGWRLADLRSAEPEYLAKLVRG